MKRSNIIIASALFAMMGIAGCTSNQKVRNFGGTEIVDLPSGQKLVNASWDDGNDLWYLTRDAKDGEKPETMTFYEKGSVGALNGKIIFREHTK